MQHLENSARSHVPSIAIEEQEAHVEGDEVFRLRPDPEHEEEDRNLKPQALSSNQMSLNYTLGRNKG